MNNKNYKILKILFVLILTVSVTLSLEINKPLKNGISKEEMAIRKDTLRAIIDFTESIREKGFPVGFHYEILNRFSKQTGIYVEVIPNFSRKTHWDELLLGEIDILVSDLSRENTPDLFDGTYLSSIPVRNNDAWVILKEGQPILNMMNEWLSYFAQTTEYSSLNRQYFNPVKIRHSYTANIISPYDDIIKENSMILGWDWRLLAAVIYQESHFNMNIESKKSAKGLMQVLPSTAKAYGIDNLYSPENNIKAGVLHLEKLYNTFIQEGLEEVEAVKFALASYNAGLGRIQDCMKIAYSNGYDYRSWDDVANAIPLLRQEEHYNSDFIRHGRFRGSETISYVDNIMERYERYCENVRG